MKRSPSQPSCGLRDRGRACLRQLDQPAAASLIALSLLMMAVYWIAVSRQGRQPIEIERAEPLQAPLLVDLNRAAWPELTLLPGISETYARRIVQYRQQQGPFAAAEELLQVPGIGPKTLAALRPYLAPLETEPARPLAAVPQAEAIQPDAP